MLLPCSPSTATGAILFLFTLVNIHSTRAQYLTASTCVSPSGFTQCYNNADSFYQSCIAKAGTNVNDVQACICVLQLSTLNCAMSNCWNVVYGCEYQILANAYATSCSNPVPFFPAPDNAPGGCSCNLGYVVYNSTLVEFEYKDCISSDVSRNDGCTCCQQAAGYAAIYGICPTTNPNLTSLAGADASDIFDVQSPNLKDGECSSVLASYDCSSLGYTALGVPFMTSVNSATFGAQSLSNTNTRTLSSPASGATFTWTDLGLAYTVVAASASAGGKASSSSSSTGKASTNTAATSAAMTGSASSAAASASGSASPSATTSMKSSANRICHSVMDWRVGLLTLFSLYVHLG